MGINKISKLFLKNKLTSTYIFDKTYMNLNIINRANIIKITNQKPILSGAMLQTIE